MRGSTGPESSSPTLVGIRASIRCSSGFLSAARICFLWEKNQNTSITATTAPKNITMVINQIICARTQTDDSAEPTARGPSFTELNCTSVVGRCKITEFSNLAGRREDPFCFRLRRSTMFHLLQLRRRRRNRLQVRAPGETSQRRSAQGVLARGTCLFRACLVA